MNYNVLRIISVSLCLYVSHVYSMSDQEKTIELVINTQETIQRRSDTYQIENAEQIKEQALARYIRNRKICNVVYGLTTLAMMGVDIANSYCDEKGLLQQERSDYWRHLGPCECPNRSASCDVSPNRWSKETCELTAGSAILYGVNDLNTIYRLYAGGVNLYCLYSVQQALNEQLVTPCTKTTSCVWQFVQGWSSGVIGTIAGISGIVNGIQNYPRTVGVWGLNAALDFVGAFNWHGNMKACEEFIK